MASKRGKRPGLKARSKNARTKAKAKKRSGLTVKLKIDGMHFRPVEGGVPPEGATVLVRIHGDDHARFLFGQVIHGRFCRYSFLEDVFIEFAHPSRITHWMRVYDPVPPSPAKAEAETAQPELPVPIAEELSEQVAGVQAMRRAMDHYL